MLSSSLLFLLVLFHGSVVFASDQELGEDVPSSTLPPENPCSSSIWDWPTLRWMDCLPADKCRRDQFLVPSFPDHLDMKKMMGRWFVGMVSHQYPYHHPASRKCIIYEFGRLITDHGTTSFNVTLTWVNNRKSASKIPERNVGYMQSSHPRIAKLMYHSSLYTSLNGHKTKFWVYKVGPDGKDSFGRLQYEYAVVGSCDRLPVLVIARNPQTFEEKYKKEVMDWLDGKGILSDYRYLQPDYSDCYFDSFTQAFGESVDGSKEAPLAIRPHFDSNPVNRSCNTNFTNITLAEELDTQKMMGRWFEGLSSLPNDNHTCIVHEYRPLKFIGSHISIDGNVQIRFEIVKSYRDVDYPKDMKKDDPILVRTTETEIPKFSNFWILNVGQEGRDPFGRIQYEYIIMSDCNKSWVLVLTRSPEMFKIMHKKTVLNWLEENDFNIGEKQMVHPDYSSCHYADSIALITGQS